MKFIGILIVLTGLSAGGYFLWRHGPVIEPTTNASSRPTTAFVQSRDIRFMVNDACDIGPVLQISVRPEVNRPITDFPVDIADKVGKAELLCRLVGKNARFQF